MSSKDQTDKGDRIGTPLEKKLEEIIPPFQRFTHDQTTGSVLLIICTTAALLLANSSLDRGYESLLHIEIGLVLGDWSLSMSLRHWINEGLMSLFFFLLGLEIKRELLVGELRGASRSLPMIAAALGGMLVPALFYTAFTAGTPLVHGWGIPMATDTAFAVGVLALLRKHIPAGLTTFLTALAIIDDLGAILVIAMFYTDTINLFFLAAAVLLLLFLIVLNAAGMRRPSVYFLIGGLVWLAMLGSGVHATVAGVLVALTVPARPKRGPDWFVNRTHELADEFASIEAKSVRPLLGEEAQHAVAERVQDTVEKATTPLQRWERYLETPVALLVMPIFALANAGIPIQAQSLSGLWSEPLAMGIMLGLVFGKAIGITFMTWLSLRLGLGQLSEGVHMRHIAGIGLLGGMGFTMSIFITNLGFESEPVTLITAKTSILFASLVAGVAGFLWLRLQSRVTQAGS
ncbi:MAG: Na+/H+ antiporter NhaA [Gammaproteobacteria bacterium]|nr:Na+/H+ antiporter NhaA [Gammaproteobacteria bacterium]